jgi:hypothetical protein
MVKTEDRVELLTEMFHKELQFDHLYSRSELEDLMDKHMDYYYNVTALTYNRWNKGMSYTCPLFEHTDRGTYRYLGPNYPYNGIVSHYPQGVSEEFIIGRWSNGSLRFTDPQISSFKEWVKSDYDGERISSIGSKVTVSRDGKQNFKFLLSIEGGGLTDGFGHISSESKLGSNLKGKQVGENFEMDGVIYEILKIE